MSINSIAVVGAGTMGSGIAQTAITCGIEVLVVEQDDAKVEQGLDRVRSGLDRFVARDKLTSSQAAEALERLTFSTELVDISKADMVIEAVFEDVALKLDILGQIDRLISPDVPIASNTSTIPLVILAGATKRPDSVVGLHFFNPVPLMKLVEVIKTPISLPANIDVPGFVGNLLVVPFLLDAIRAFERGVAPMESIDEVLQLGFNHRMGPF